MEMCVLVAVRELFSVNERGKLFELNCSAAKIHVTILEEYAVQRKD